VQADTQAAPFEKSKVMANVVTIIEKLARINGEFDLDARFFKLAVWKEIEAALAEGLREFPDAARSVALRLREVEDRHSPSGDA
jgi:hypothetical protein